MNERARTTGTEARITMVDSAVLEFRIDYEQTKQLPAGEFVHSDVLSVGGHLWRIECYPRGETEDDKGEHIAIFLVRIGKTRSVKAIFEAFLMGRDGKPSTSAARRMLNSFQIGDCTAWGWNNFVKRTTVEKDYVIDGHITFVFAIMVIDDSRIHVPRSDIGIHLGHLLDHTEGTDVSFVIDGETFGAHRAVLAARSPVFKAELLGSMAEAAMSSITLHDITPATFKAMLRFMYTDALPGDNELGGSLTVLYQDLLAAADRYALDRLKLMCAQKLWDNMTVDTVATTLACAETYNCPELKSKCFNFFEEEKNFKKAVFTDGFAMLVQKFPSITAELRERVAT